MKCPNHPAVRNAFRVVLVFLALVGGALRAGALDPVPPPPVASDAELLDLVERTAFEYFWQEANPANGLVRDRSQPHSKCSIAAVGFGLSALCIGVERGYVPRAQAAERVRSTLRTFASGRQGPEPAGTIGHRGWYYHFLEMDTATRAWRCELSTIDTALLLAGAMDASQFFDRPDAVEGQVRALAAELVDRVDWQFFLEDQATLSMGWHPETGFIARRWEGYNEGMLLYVLGLGSARRPLGPASWKAWTHGYSWQTNFGIAHVAFPPLFGHQYSHCWIDFRGLRDDWMSGHGLDYFENSRRATLAQRAYCIANPKGHVGYGALGWGITACDGPPGYGARGAPPPENDDGTLAPTAVGGSLPFAPEVCLPTLREFHRRWGGRMWTRYGFRDAINPGKDWVADDVLGIDQGAMIVMAENHRTGAVWKRMMRHPVIVRGLERAGFRKHPGP